MAESGVLSDTLNFYPYGTYTLAEKLAQGTRANAKYFLIAFALLYLVVLVGMLIYARFFASRPIGTF